MQPSPCPSFHLRSNLIESLEVGEIRDHFREVQILTLADTQINHVARRNELVTYTKIYWKSSSRCEYADLSFLVSDIGHERQIRRGKQLKNVELLIGNRRSFDARYILVQFVVP